MNTSEKMILETVLTTGQISFHIDQKGLVNAAASMENNAFINIVEHATSADCFTATLGNGQIWEATKLLANFRK